MGPVQKLISIVHWKGSEVLAFCEALESFSNPRDLPFRQALERMDGQKFS